MVAPCVFPSPRGSQVLIRELAQALAGHGHVVHLVTYPHGESLVPIHGIFVHRIRPPRFAVSPSGLGWQKILLDVCLAWTLYRVVRRERIQVIHAHNYEGPLVSYLVRGLTRVPVVYHSHNALSDELGCYVRPGWRRRVAQYVGAVLDRQIPRRADFSIALTPELERFLRAHGVAEDRVATIPPGCVAATMSDNAVRDAAAFSSRFVVMYAGNLDPYQDLDVLFRGFATFRDQVPNALLVLVTHEARWAERAGARLQRLRQEDAARVVVASAFSVVRRLLASADVLVCPRSSWSGFPIKLINYMAAGRAVVAAEGSAKGMVDGVTGVIFRNGDAGDLAAALHRLFADPALRERLGEHAQVAISASAGWTGAVTRIVRIYAQVCAPPSRPDLRRRRVRRLQGLMVSSGERISAASGNGSA
jgi:1,2-diacylglycerol 3-alpha-glucosyltransferase